MENRFGRMAAACLLATFLPTAGLTQGYSTFAPAVQWLDTADAEQAAEYLASIIRVYGCSVDVEQRENFNGFVMAYLGFDFGIEPQAVPQHTREDGTIARVLYAFSTRAGAHLVRTGQLSMDADGAAHLAQCGMLTS